MQRDTLLLQVRQAAAEYFGQLLEDITEESFLVSDLDGDDLDVTQFTLELEDEFNVILNDPEDDEAVTIKTLVDDLQAALNTGTPTA